MTDHKFTDEEVIKALELCFAKVGTTNSCAKCPYRRIRLCKIERDRAALNLINRQKAELERLLSMNQAKLDMIHDLQTDLETAKAEAIKEFADRLKVTAYMQSTITGYQHHVVDVSDIDYLAEKMIEKE